MLIYHLARAEEWAVTGASGAYAGGAHDRRDGFIHFSTKDQIVESAARHRAGEEGLLLLAVEADVLGEALRWEPSRGGALFPHLYGLLPPAAVVWAVPLPLDAARRHVFPELSD
jgi:uncharacterized protein (DUF952 family)